MLMTLAPVADRLAAFAKRQLRVSRFKSDRTRLRCCQLQLVHMQTLTEAASAATVAAMRGSGTAATDWRGCGRSFVKLQCTGVAAACRRGGGAPQAPSLRTFFLRRTATARARRK